MTNGFREIIKSGNGNTLVYTALIAAMLANALPTPADSFYFQLQFELKRDLESGKITPKEYWSRDILNYYTYTAAWYALLLLVLLAIDGEYKNNAKIIVVLISGGLVFGIWKKNIEKDNALLELQKQYKIKANGN